MILTPFASASTVTTFSDGSSEVVVEFKDGVNSENTTDGGFYVPSDETITSASIDILSDPMMYSTDDGANAFVNYVWDSTQNNGATDFDNLDSFSFGNSGTNYVELSSESFISDFESGESGFTPSRDYVDSNDEIVSWDYGMLDFKQLIQGPESCKSGDMCWGTNLYDEDYTDDYVNPTGSGNNQMEYKLTTPVTYLDTGLVDTYLRFASWHQFETKINSQGDAYYDDCGYMEIEYSQSGLFQGEENVELLSVNLNPQFTNGVSPNQGLFLQGGSSQQANRISQNCYGIESNYYAFAGTSVSGTNPGGWATVAANLALYLGNYVRINFILTHSDTPGNTANLPYSGWYIDDVSIGEPYSSSGEMVVKNLQPNSRYSEKSPDGYGILYTDTFEPGDSSLTYSFRNSQTGAIVTDTDGIPFVDLEGPVIQLWDIDVDLHPYLDMEVNFQSGQDRSSTPVFYGYHLGSEVGITFNDMNAFRHVNIINGDYIFTNDTETPETIYMNSSSFISTNNYYHFKKPVYGVKISGIPQSCNAVGYLTSPSIYGDVSLNVGTDNALSVPVSEFDLGIEFNNDCNVREAWISLTFGQHIQDLTIDFGNDSFDEWAFNQPAFGLLGLQNTFYSTELNGISTSSKSSKFILDPITGNVISGFFLTPKGSTVQTVDFSVDGNTIYNVNNSQEGFELSLIVGQDSQKIADIPNQRITDFHDTVPDINRAGQILTGMLQNPTVPVFKTDDSGIDWVRVGFKATQTESNNGGGFDIKDLRVIYEYDATIGDNIGFSEYIGELVAINNQNQQTQPLTYIPVHSTSASGGKVTLSNLQVTSQPGYDSTLAWNNDLNGLYDTGDIYHIQTTHSVQASTGANLQECRIKFKTAEDSLFLGYNPTTGFYEIDDSDYISLHPSSSVTQSGPQGEIQVDWKFTVNSSWDDQAIVVILSQTLADDGVTGMLSGILLDSAEGNAIENDIQLKDFSLYNSAGYKQDLSQGYSNQEFNLRGNVSFENLDATPNPMSYNLVVEERGVEIDGEFTNITWTEIANRTGFIGGAIDWNINLGLFASGSETYRFKITNFDGGDVLCPPAEYNPDLDCAIQFDLSVDILDPNLISFELRKEENINSDWRYVYDDSWASPKLSQEFRLTVSDLPTPPESAVLHVWVEYDHDANSNGIAEESEYIQISTTNSGNGENASFIGTYNDMANSGLKGVVSVWVECYDLAGNSVDGGGPGLSNDYVTYVSMDRVQPSITSLYIENTVGERLITPPETNVPDGVGIWNQTMFAGNEYTVVIDAQDGNGWRDIDYVKITLAPQEVNYNSEIIYHPRTQTIFSESDIFELVVDSSGDSKATIRTSDGNVLIDPFVESFSIRIPIRINFGLPLSDPQKTPIYTPSFEIKDLDGGPIFSESSYRQKWIYQNDIRLDFRSDLSGKRMISPTLTDQDVPISENLYHEIGQEKFIGSVTGGDIVMFSGQYSFTSGMLQNVFINPETELTMQITRKEVFRDTEKDYDPVEEEITIHSFTGGKFDIPIKMPSYQNEFEYEFELINLPQGASDLTDSSCFGSLINGCGKFVIKVDDEPPELVFGSWSASRGETVSNGLEPQLFDKMPTSTYHCVDISSQIEERGSLDEDSTTLNWMYFNGNPDDGNVWNVYQNNYGTTPLSTPLNLSAGSLGYIRASADCVDLWPLGFGQFDVTESNLNQPNLEINLVIWVETVDSAGSPLIGGGRYFEDGSAVGIEGNDNDGQDSSSYVLEFEDSDFKVRNIRTNPSSPTVGDKITLEVELVNSGIPGIASLEIKSVTNSQPPVFEAYVTSEIIGKDQSQWVSIELEEFTDATTGMYYIVYDNETKNILFNGKDEGKAFNVKLSSDDGGGISTSLIVIILIGVIAVLAVVVVVISRRDRGDDFDDEFETGYEEDKSYASIPSKTQTYTAPAAAVSPEMAEALEKFNFWTQEEIQGYFDQGWSIQQLEDWLENQ